MEFYQFIGYLLGLLMGITLGLIGAGGSALTVPIMVFLFQLDAEDLPLVINPAELSSKGPEQSKTQVKTD